MNGIGYKIKKTILYILLILLSVVCMFPFLLMIVNATRSGSEIMKSFTLIPSVYLKENWATVFKYFNLFLGMWNSLKVAVPSTLLCAYFSAMTAYALAMYKFKGNKVLFMTILIFMMIPGQLGLIGFYNLCTKLWSETLPKLLLASNEAQFDEIFEEFVGKRNAMGYQEVLKQKTVLMNAAKEKMGISE